MAIEETLGDIFHLVELSLGGRAGLVHVKTTGHRTVVGILPAGVGIHLGVEHEQVYVGAILKDDLGYVLESNVSHAAVATDAPYFG